ncbi:hypothetical protein BGZ58_003047, partial [Dissophora ornata]
ARLNPIVYIPPTVLLLAIIGILVYRYNDNIQDAWYSALYRLRGGYPEEATEEDALLYEDYEEGDLEEELEEPYDQDQQEHRDDDQADVEPQGSTTSARLRMHHDMVQQMRARAGFAPEPFPGDEDENAEGGDVNEDEEGEGEDDGGVGSSNGAIAAGSAGRIKKIGKKKAEKLQRKEQMRAYREFMDMQREERRQQEELFKVQEAVQQEERRQKRSAQIEKDRRRKAQLKEKAAKENDSKMRRMQSERLKDEKARGELRAYLQRVRSFRLTTLARRLGRTEAQLLKDLSAVAQDDDLASDRQDSAEGTSTARITLASNLTVPSSPHSPSAAPSRAGSSRPQLLILRDPASDQYVILDETKLAAFADMVKSKGRIDKRELSSASEGILP